MDHTYELHNGDNTVSYMSKEVAESLKVIAQICYGEKNCAACPWRIKDEWCLLLDSINGIDVRNDEPTGRKKRLKSSHSWDISFVSDVELHDWLTSVLTGKSKDKEDGGSECDE